MSIEFSNNERIISDAEWQQLKREAQRYLDLVNTKTKGASRSANHILANSAANFVSVLEIEPKPEQRFEAHRRVTESINDINRYLKLLEDFPDFAEKELKQGKGCFPEIIDKLFGVIELLDAYEAEMKI